MRRARLAVLTVVGVLLMTGVATAGTLTFSPGSTFAFGMRSVAGGSFSGSLTLNNAMSNTVVSGFTLGGTCGEFTASAINPGNSNPISATNTLTMANGDTLTIDLTYDPADRTADNCTVTVENDTGGSAETFQITGDGAAAQLAVNPTSRDYGNVRWNTGATGTHVFTVTNPGEEAATVSVGFMTGGQGYSAAPSSISVPATSGSSTTTITFDPASAGTKNDTATFTAANSVSNPMASLTGIGVASNQGFTAASFNIGSAAVGAQVNGSATVTNTGATASLNIAGVVITGTDAADFVLTDAGCTGQSCGTANVAAGANRIYNIRCTPSGGGTRTATLEVTSDDPSSGGASSLKTAALSCTGSPTIQTSPTSISFGNQRVGVPSGNQNLTISNPTGASSFQYTVTLDGGAAGHYVLSCGGGGSACFTNRTLAGGQSETVQVAFSPPLRGRAMAIW